MAEFVSKPKEHTNGHCKNCGHPSHCGGSLQQEVRDYPVDVKDNYTNTWMIEVCKSCRCKNCTKQYGKKKIMKLHKGFVEHETTPKKTSIGNNTSRIKKSSMNKHKRRSYKPYRGQGK